MSLALRLRPVELLAPLGGAALMFLVLGPTLRGVAAALLAAAAALATRLLPRTGRPPGPRPLEVVEQLRIGPRMTLLLVETAGRRYLVGGGASVTPLPLEERP